MSWLTNQWKGYLCTFVSGTGSGQSSVVASNTTDTLTFQSELSVAPDATTVFTLALAENSTVASGADQVLGTDVALDDTFDIDLAGSGDFQTLSGNDNMSQALGIKFRTEQGSLIAHNYFGIVPQVGSKVNFTSLSQHRLNARRTLLSDARIESIRKLSFVASKDVVNMTGEVVLKVSGLTRSVNGAF